MAPTAVAATAAGSASMGVSAGEDQLTIEMLGAGQEVGRSCCVITYKGKTVVCDAGVHPAYTGLAALPFIDELDWSTVDALLITHFHLDHAAALTYIMEKTNFRDGKGKVYMTHPTKAVYRFLMSDFVRISNAGADENLFDENEMLTSWRQIEAVDYHQDVSVGGGLRFTPYHAGHVLGACMYMIEIAGLRVLYTGDFSREEDRHLVQAEVPPVRPDVLICESTYGVQSLPPRIDKEERFTALIHSIVRRGGRVLLPVFVLGRAQELLLLLDEYWSQHPELHSIPVYYASSLARKCIAVYQTYIHTMNDHIRSRFNRRDNPFVFKHISNLRSLDKFEDKGPCVMMASPGFMQSGVSRELLERWAPDKRNGLIVSGYSVEGTMARNILNEPDEIIGMNGQKIPRRMSVDYISFSAHVDYTQNARFIDEVKAQHVVLVHGEQNNMSRLRAALQSKYSDRAEDVKIHTPRNCEPLHLRFKAERLAKAIGVIAAKPPAPGNVIDGMLVSKDFAYTILDPKDLTDFTGLSTSTIIQRQRMALAVGWEMARWHLEGMYGKMVEGLDVEGLRTMRIMGAVDVKQSGPHELTIEWVSSVPNDMVADSVVALLLGVDSSPASVKMTMHSHKHDHGHGRRHGDTVMTPSKREWEGSPEASTNTDMDGVNPYADQARPTKQISLEDHRDSESEQTALSYNLTKMEHIAAFLEAHYGQIEEVWIGEEPSEEPAVDMSQEFRAAAATTTTTTETTSTTTSSAAAAADPNGEAIVIKPDPDVEEDPPAPNAPTEAATSTADGGAGTASAAAETQVKAEEDDCEEAMADDAPAPGAREVTPLPKPLTEAFDGPARAGLRVTLDEHEAILDVSNLIIVATSESLRSRVQHLTKMALRTLTSIDESFVLPQQLGSNVFMGAHGVAADLDEVKKERDEEEKAAIEAGTKMIEG